MSGRLVEAPSAKQGCNQRAHPMANLEGWDRSRRPGRHCPSQKVVGVFEFAITTCRDKGAETAGVSGGRLRKPASCKPKRRTS